jgi:hypothetical protein
MGEEPERCPATLRPLSRATDALLRACAAAGRRRAAGHDCRTRCRVSMTCMKIDVFERGEGARGPEGRLFSVVLNAFFVCVCYCLQGANAACIAVGTKRETMVALNREKVGKKEKC